MLKAILSACLLCLASFCQAQYFEGFSTPNKGYLLNFVDDFSGIDWTLGPWAKQPPVQNGRDISDYFQTTPAGRLESIDLDEEVCWESPLLSTISVAGTVSLSVDLSWDGFDPDNLGDPCMENLDYIKVQYSVNGGAYITAPNIAGGSICATVGYLSTNPNGPFQGAATVQVNGIPGGSTLQIRVCVNTNANAELVTIDNVKVPESGVTQGCSAPDLSTVVTPITCHGPNSGAINLTVLGGTPGYTYSWSNGSIAEDIGGLALGVYTVTVTDAASCTATASATVNAVPFSFSADIGPATCEGLHDGAVDLMISGGTAPYTVDWGDLPGNSNPEDRTGLEAGAYTVTVSDAGGCTAEADVNIGFAPTGAYLETFDVEGKGLLPGSTCTDTNATSCSAHNFVAVNWSIYGLDTLFGIDPDDYFYTLDGKLEARDLDQIVCWESPLIDIDPPGTGVVFSLDLSWEGFDAEPPGADPLDLIADHIDVEYSLDGGPWTRVANQAGGGLTGHTIVYANAAGSGQNDNITVTVSNLAGATLRIRVCGFLNSNAEVFTIDNVSVPSAAGLYCPLPALGLVSSDVTCFGGSDGAINLSVSGGTPPYSFEWSNGAMTEDISDLSAGQYTVTITSGGGLTLTAEVMIAEPAEIMVTQDLVTSSPISCIGNSDGILAVEMTNGQAPFTFEWSNGETTNPIENLGAGTYSVTVTDVTGCSATLDDLVLSEPAEIIVGQDLSASSPISCFGNSDGILAVELTNGQAPFTFEWSNGEMTNPIENLGAGTYSVTATDAAGCTATLDDLVLSEPAEMLVAQDLGASNSVSCFGSSDGILAVELTNGQAPFTFEWSNGDTTNPVENLGAGTYTVTVTDAAGCTATLDNLVLDEPVEILVAQDLGASSPVSCFGNSDGILAVELTNGQAPFSFLWSNGETTNPAENLNAGTYTVTVTDAAGCTAVLDNIILNEPGAIVVSQDPSISNPISCRGDADGVIGVQWTNGQAPFQYLWSNGATTNPAENLGSGVYTVTVTDAAGCTGVLDNNELIEPSQVQGILDPFAAVCPGEMLDLSINTIFGGSGAPYQFNVDGGVLYNSNLSIPTGAGQHIVGYFDKLGCNSTDTIVIEESLPSNAMIAGQDTACTNMSLAYNLSFGAFNNYNWTISSNGIIESWNGTSGIVALWTTPGVGLVQVTFNNADNCPDTATLTVLADICIGTTQPTLPGVQIMPNPFGNWLAVQFDRAVEAGTQLQLFDLSGRLVLEREIAGQHTRLDTGDLPEGMYFLRLQEGERFGLWKMVK